MAGHPRLFPGRGGADGGAAEVGRRRKRQERLRFVWFNELSFSDILERSSALPPHSAIFYRRPLSLRALEQNQDLAGRLITAQEADRSRIGRDLPDDVWQRLAVLAMMQSGLEHRAGSTPQPDLEEVLTTLQARMSTLATDVRNLSHDLHRVSSTMLASSQS